MPTYTSNYTLAKPLVNSAVDQDLWGTELNSDIDSIDALLRSGITIAPQTSQTTGFSASASISIKYLYPCDATGGAFAATLPAAATAGNGATVFIKKTDSTANAITVTRSSSDTIDGSTTYAINIQNQLNGFISDGTSKWYVMTEGVSVVPDATTSVKGIVELATDAETRTATDTVRAVTPSNLGASILGFGQTWQNVAASRAISTSYQNTTGRPIQIAIIGSSGGSAQTSVDNLTWITVGGGGSDRNTDCNAIIPNNWYYRYQGGSFTTWTELR